MENLYSRKKVFFSSRKFFFSTFLVFTLALWSSSPPIVAESAAGVNWDAISSHGLKPSTVVDLRKDNKISKVKVTALEHAGADLHHQRCVGRSRYASGGELYDGKTGVVPAETTARNKEMGGPRRNEILVGLAVVMFLGTAVYLRLQRWRVWRW